MNQPNRLHKRALPYFRLKGFLAGVSLVGFTSGLYHARQQLGWEWDITLFHLTFALSLVLAVHYLFIKPKRLYELFSYMEEEDILTIRSGVFVHSTVTIPYFRIQHVQTEQGPLLRHFDLARVTVFTAGSVYVIPAISVEEAQALRVRLSMRAKEMSV